MAKVSVAEAVVDCLIQEGISHAFNLSGSQILPLLSVMDANPKTRVVLTRHEQGASMMALGYAHATRAPALCMGTAGPGAINLMAGIAAAHKDHIPLLAITGMHPMPLHYRDMHGEQDQVMIYRPITKMSEVAYDPNGVPDLVRRAFRIATTGEPGPVHIAIPQDVQKLSIEHTAMDTSQYRSEPRMDCDLSKMAEIVETLNQARCPVLLIGHEVSWEGANSELIDAAENLGIPVITALECDAIPYVHPLAVGAIGHDGSTKLAKVLAKEADVLLAVGTDFDHRSTMFRYEFFSPKTKLIQVSRYAENLGKHFPVHIKVEGSSRHFLKNLTEKVRDGALRCRRVNIGKRKEEWERERLSGIDRDAKPIQDKYVARMIREGVPDNAIMVSDIGHFARGVILQQFEFRQANTYFSTREYGAIGTGLPYAIGVKLARPDQEVILAAGDGGFMLNVSELETAVRERVKVTVVVYNDRGLTSERMQMKREYGGRYFASEFGDVDFAKLAQSMGAFGIRVTEPSKFPSALSKALNNERTAVVDVVGYPDVAGR